MHNQTKQLILSGIFIALGLIIPPVFHSFAMGAVLLPMHIPVLLSSFLLSPFFAFLVGALTPLLSSLLTGMPPFFPIAVQMTFELATYGLSISYLYHKCHKPLFFSLLSGMLAGRLSAGLVNFLLLTEFLNKVFSLNVFLMASFVTSLPGIILQLILIPILIKITELAPLLRKDRDDQQLS
jgi:uncharacterized membrane protein